MKNQFKNDKDYMEFMYYLINYGFYIIIKYKDTSYYKQKKDEIKKIKYDNICEYHYKIKEINLDNIKKLILNKRVSYINIQLVVNPINYIMRINLNKKELKQLINEKIN